MTKQEADKMIIGERVMYLPMPPFGKAEYGWLIDKNKTEITVKWDDGEICVHRLDNGASCVRPA